MNPATLKQITADGLVDYLKAVRRIKLGRVEALMLAVILKHGKMSPNQIWWECGGDRDRIPNWDEQRRNNSILNELRAKNMIEVERATPHKFNHNRTIFPTMEAQALLDPLES